jgi:hypothetical protein
MPARQRSAEAAVMDTAVALTIEANKLRAIEAPRVTAKCLPAPFKADAIDFFPQRAHDLCVDGALKKTKFIVIPNKVRYLSGVELF